VVDCEFREVPINPDLDGQNIDAEAVMPGPIMGLRMLLDVALGSEEESRKYLEGFVQETRKHRSDGGNDEGLGDDHS
jgi:hypothetical protein